MGFRDDGEAARARAEALARELAERDAQIETLKAELERKRAKLREVEEEASPVAESAENTERARRALEALKAKNAEHAREREAKAKTEHTAEQSVEQAEAKEREARLLRSSSVWGDVDLIGLLPLAGLPAFWGILYFGVSGRPLYAALLPVGLVLAVFAVKLWGQDWARRVARREEEWARSLPYALDGYPEALAVRPASGGSTFFHKLDGDEHRILSIELELADGTVPADLGAIMTGFDPELGTSNPLLKDDDDWFHARESRLVEEPNVFLRLSPVTTSRHSVEDHNRAVRDWVRRFEREVLRPLHARRPLARVTVRLR